MLKGKTDFSLIFAFVSVVNLFSTTMTKYSLVVADYIVISMTLLISAGIGVWFRFTGNRQKTTQDYLMAGKDMPKLPVILSATVTILSPATMLGSPAEVYRFGITVFILYVFITVGIQISAFVLIPVYFQCGVSTSYEYLEIRFGKILRYTTSALFVAQMVFFMAISIYGPVLALGAVTDLSLEMSIVIIGVICTFYCMMGGLKAVLWSDVFQAILMVTFVIILLSKGISEAGGVAEIFRKSWDGGRLKFWNFSPDMTLRYTIWNTAIKGTISGMAYFGTSQIEVQRMLSLRNSERARSSLLWSSLTTVILSGLSCFSGLIMYGIFHTCDPIKDSKNTGIKKYDQIIPYYIVTRFSALPGLTGLCVAGIFSGALSTMSSALNSVSTVTVMDFIRPLFASHITDKRTVVIAKCLSVMYGLICIGLTFAIAKLDSIMATAITLMGALEGPVVAVFLIGVLTRKGTEKCALIGMIVGVVSMCWIGYGSLFSGFVNPSLPSSTSECLSQANSHQNSSLLCQSNTTCASDIVLPPRSLSEPFILYQVAFLWIAVLGFFVSLILIFMGILITGCKDTIPIDSKCLSPVSRLWFKLDTSDKNIFENTNDIILEEKLPQSC